MKKLQSQIQQVTSTYFDIQDTFTAISDVTKRAQQVEVFNISRAVFLPFNHEILKSIKEEGLRKPLVLLPNTQEVYENAVQGLTNKLPYDESKPFLCIFGNQRLVIARYLQYDTVSCFIADNPIDAVTINKRSDDLLRSQ